MERPIIFDGESVRGILAGTKSQTRRTIFKDDSQHHSVWWCSGTHWQDGDAKLRCSFAAGDTLWVRETYCQKMDDGTFVFTSDGDLDPTCFHYAADGYQVSKDDGDGGTEYRKNGREASPWRSPMFMPRHASRITLRITDVRVERVQAISEADAVAEGCVKRLCTREDTELCEPGSQVRELAKLFEGGYLTAKSDFCSRWHQINGKRAPWHLNPWVWCLTFERI